MPLVTICLLAFLSNLGYGIVLPMLPRLLTAADVGVALMGAVYACFSGTKLFAQLVGGVVTDRYGARRALAASAVCYAGSLASLPLAASAPAFLAVRALNGVALGLSFPAATALVAQRARPGQFGRDLGLLMGASGAGLVVGPLLGIALATWSPARLLGTLAAVTLAASVLILTVPPAPSPERPRPLSAEVGELWRFLTCLPFLALVAPFGFNKMAFSVFQPLLPLHGPALGLSNDVVAVLFAATGVLFAGAQPIAGRLADRNSPRTLTGVALVVTVGSVLAMALFPSPIAFCASYLAWCLFGSMLFTANLKLIGDHFGEKDAHGKLFGVAQSVTDVGLVIAPLSILPMYEHSAPALFLALVGVGCAALLFFRSARGARALPAVQPSSPG